MHIYRWDLDKTYLDTDIESVRGLIRTALESARDKQTIPGAAELIRQLRSSDPSARVHILSGSPKQMRSVIQEKLRLDGVEVDRITLKDNLGNIRRGRLRDVRGQLGYKLPRLLQQRVGVGASVQETLFGDDSEVDALVYRVYADVLSGTLGINELARILEAGGAYSDSIDKALEAAERIERADAVRHIFIHIATGVPLSRFDLLGSLVTPIFSWMQAALILTEAGQLPQASMVKVMESCARTEPLDSFEIAGILQDSMQRGLVAAETVLPLLAATQSRLPLSPSYQNYLLAKPPNQERIDGPDYIAFLRACR